MESQRNLQLWMDCIRAWYPDYETKTYFVPPVVITRLPFEEVTVAGQPVSVLQGNPAQDSPVQPDLPKVKSLVIQGCDTREDTAPERASEVQVTSSKAKKSKRIQESDTRDDLALQRVLLCLRELAVKQNEPMFVISQLQFSDYLGEPRYVVAAKHFFRPQNLPNEYKRGVFDFLLIHRRYGIITGEIKAVLSKQLELSQDKIDKGIADKLRRATKLLNKSKVVLREITKDLEPKIAIRKVLILPYVTAGILTRVVSSDEKLKQELITCLEVEDMTQALKCCLLADNLSSDGNEMVNIPRFPKWWSTFVAVKSDSEMKSDTYLDLLARFCGPATTVSIYCSMTLRIEVRTEGQGVVITGKRMTSLVLTPEQISLLTRAPRRVMLTGPPGAGKSVMLVLMALTWLSQGHDVHLVSIWLTSLAATLMLKEMIEETLRKELTTPSEDGRVLLHEYDFYNKETDVDKAINMFTATKRNQGPYVICDEFFTVDSQIDRYKRFVTTLCKDLPDLCLWAASTFLHQRPAELQEEPITIPLRCPPAVLSEVQKAINMSEVIHSYKTTVLTTPCDGPNVIQLSHQGPGHTPPWPLECDQCGKSIAEILHRLGVGVTDTFIDNNFTTTGDNNTNTRNASRAITCPTLRFNDVLILTRSLDLRDDVVNETGRVTSTANGIVRGLRDVGIPVRVIRKGHETTDVYDLTVSQRDTVTVSFYGHVSGLERKVVVWLPDSNPGVNTDLEDAELYPVDKLFAISRCTAQLVVVDVPRA